MRRLVVAHVGPDAVRDVPVVEARQRHHLVLPQDVPGKAVGVDAGRALRVGHVVDLAMRLLEGLDDAERREPLAPGQHLRERPADRMPERDAGFGSLDRFAVDVRERAVDEDGGAPRVARR